MSSSPTDSMASHDHAQSDPSPQLWCGPSTPTEATVYLRWPTSELSAASDLQATIRGPYCEWARTLPATFDFQAESPGLWKTIVLDPVFWAPDFPARYRVQWKYAKLDNSQHMPSRPASGQRELAIRQWGVRTNHLWLNGHRWVWRAAAVGTWPLNQLANCHEHLLGIVLPNLNQEWLQRASVLGVNVGLRLATSRPADGATSAETIQAVIDDLREASKWPAVMMAILPTSLDVPRESLRAAAPNLLLAGDLPPGVPRDGQPTIPRWCDVLLAHDNPDQLMSIRSFAPTLPTIARRLLPHLPNEAADARRQCEQLQRDLVERFDLSGYQVEYAT